MVGIFNMCLSYVLSAFWIQTLWGMLCFWLFFDGLLIDNDLKILRASHDDMVVRYTHLNELYNRERNLNVNELASNKSELHQIKNLILAQTNQNSLNMSPLFKSSPAISTNTQSSSDSDVENCTVKLPSMLHEHSEDFSEAMTITLDSIGEEYIARNRKNMIEKSRSHPELPLHSTHAYDTNENTVMSISIKTKGRLGLAGNSCVLP